MWKLMSAAELNCQALVLISSSVLNSIQHWATRFRKQG